MKHIKPQIQSTYDFWLGMNAFYECWAKKHNITEHTLSVLLALEMLDSPYTLQQLCQKLSMPKQTLYAIINHMEQDGFLVRSEHSTDKRSKYITLTTAGKKYQQSLLGELHKLEENALSKFNPEEQEKLLKLNHLYLEHLTNSLELI